MSFEGDVRAQKRIRRSPADMDWNLHATIVQQTVAEMDHRCAWLVQSLELGTRNYLTTLFWTHYNSYIQLTRKELFSDALEYGSLDFYSPTLHLAILAIGLRHADHSRPDIGPLVLAGRESRFHQQLKLCVETLPSDGLSTPHAQALLLLADLEYAVGRETSARVYLGRAMQETQEAGSAFSSPDMVIADGEVLAQRMLQRSCRFFIGHWSLLDKSRSCGDSGRTRNVSAVPTYVKKFQKSVFMKGTESEIYVAHLELLELSKKMTEYFCPFRTRWNPDLVNMLTTAHSQLESWHRELDGSIKWAQQNLATATPSFFLLHQQYQATLISLHQPFIQRNESFSSAFGDDAHISQLLNHSREACVDAAAQMMHIIGEYARKFSLRDVFTTVVFQCSLACDALVSFLGFSKPERPEFAQVVETLQLLHTALQDLAVAFEPAERITSTLERISNQCTLGLKARSGLPKFSPPSNSHIHRDHRGRFLHGSSRSGIAGPIARRDVQSPSHPQSHHTLPSQRDSPARAAGEDSYGVAEHAASKARSEAEDNHSTGSREFNLIRDGGFSPHVVFTSYKEEMMHLLRVSQSSSRSNYPSNPDTVNGKSVFPVVSGLPSENAAAEAASRPHDSETSSSEQMRRAAGGRAGTAEGSAAARPETWESESTDESWVEAFRAVDKAIQRNRNIVETNDLDNIFGSVFDHALTRTG